MPDVRAYRLRAHITQAELADRAGVSPATISNIDRGATPGPRVRRAVAAALGTTPDALWPTLGSAP